MFPHETMLSSCPTLFTVLLSNFVCRCSMSSFNVILKAAPTSTRMHRGTRTLNTLKMSMKEILIHLNPKIQVHKKYKYTTWFDSKYLSQSTHCIVKSLL